MAISLVRFRPRLLPVTMFAATLMLTVKVKDVWQGVQMALQGVSVAQTVEASGAPPKEAGGHGGGEKKDEKKDPKKDNKKEDKPERKKPQTAAAGPSVNVNEPAPLQADEDPSASNPFTQAEVDLLQKLAERRKDLDERSRDLDMRESLLKAAEQRIENKVGELKNLQATIEGLLKKHDEQEDLKMKSLVKIYENMKPKDAAKIFEDLDMPILLDVVERMKEAKIAPVLAQMDPAKARAVTAEMAQRRQMPTPGG